ncbi:hypothetical protein GCM10018789_11930 [Streptomyces werraensis]|nr:hypothetical protein GCM10018789_11930 [Streptomyces werraensis]
MPGFSQNVVPAGLDPVFAERSPGTEGSTVTAPDGAFAGPGFGVSHTRATDRGAPPESPGRVRASARDRPSRSFAGSDALSQPAVATSASASPAADAQRRHRRTSSPRRPTAAP